MEIPVPSTFELTIEQQFHQRLIEESVQKMSQSQLQDMIIDMSKLIFIKDNVIRSLLKSQIYDHIGILP